MSINSLPVPQLLQALALALIVSALGFRRVVYFISIGYAFSISGMALIFPFLLRHNLTWVSFLQSALLFVWGVRSGRFSGAAGVTARLSERTGRGGGTQRAYHRLA